MILKEQKRVIKNYSVKTSYSYETWLKFAELIEQYDIYFNLSFSEAYLRAFYELSLEQDKDLIAIGEEYNKEMKNTLCGVGAQLRDLAFATVKAMAEALHIPKNWLREELR